MLRQGAAAALNGEMKAKNATLAAQVKELQKELGASAEKARSQEKVAKQHQKEKQLADSKAGGDLAGSR
jgi:cell division protein FtsB